MFGEQVSDNEEVEKGTPRKGQQQQILVTTNGRVALGGGPAKLTSPTNGSKEPAHCQYEAVIQTVSPATKLANAHPQIPLWRVLSAANPLVDTSPNASPESTLRHSTIPERHVRQSLELSGLMLRATADPPRSTFRDFVRFARMASHPPITPRSTSASTAADMEGSELPSMALHVMCHRSLSEHEDVNAAVRSIYGQLLSHAGMLEGGQGRNVGPSEATVTSIRRESKQPTLPKVAYLHFLEQLIGLLAEKVSVVAETNDVITAVAKGELGVLRTKKGVGVPLDVFKSRLLHIVLLSNVMVGGFSYVVPLVPQALGFLKVVHSVPLRLSNSVNAAMGVGSDGMSPSHPGHTPKGKLPAIRDVDRGPSHSTALVPYPPPSAVAPQPTRSGLPARVWTPRGARQNAKALLAKMEADQHEPRLREEGLRSVISTSNLNGFLDANNAATGGGGGSTNKIEPRDLLTIAHSSSTSMHRTKTSSSADTSRRERPSGRQVRQQLDDHTVGTGDAIRTAHLLHHRTPMGQRMRFAEMFPLLR